MVVVVRSAPLLTDKSYPAGVWEADVIGTLALYVQAQKLPVT